MAARHGFTLLELVIALVFGAVLATVAVNGMGPVFAGIAVRSAQAGFLTAHAHARALAVERGRRVSLTIDPETGVVAVRFGCVEGDDAFGDLLESRNYVESYSVTIDTGGEVVSLCLTPRGVANPNLNSFSGEVSVRFASGGSRSTVRLFPLGQAVAP